MPMVEDPTTLDNESTPADSSDSDDDKLTESLSYAVQIEALHVIRAEKKRKQAAERAWRLLGDALKSWWAGPGIFAICIGIAGVLLNLSGVDPEMGKAYDAIARVAGAGECPDRVPLSSPPAPEEIEPAP